MKPFKIDFEIEEPFQEKYKFSGKIYTEDGVDSFSFDDDKCLFLRKGMFIRVPKYLLNYIMTTHGEEIKRAICATE